MKKITKILSIAVLTVGISTSFSLAEGYPFSQSAYKTGMDHKDVKVIQEALKKDGSYTYGLTTTYFGEITEKAVASFQKKNGLKADGIVGKGTLDKMNQQGLLASTGGSANTSSKATNGYVLSEKLYKKGMDHQDIELIQEVFEKDGVYNFVSFTTYFGSATEKAAIAFQKKYNLTSDGVVGQGTLDKMKQLGLISNSTSSSSSNTLLAASGYSFSSSSYKKGTNHKDVNIIQEALKKDGVFSASKTTNYFGEETEKAVKEFQKKYGLLADGVVGNGTLNKMKSIDLLPSDVKLASNATVVSRGASTGRKVGQYLDWFSEVSGKLVSRQDVLLVEDLGTGKTFQVKVTAGTNHADVEALSLEDTNIMKKIWGGFSWDRRAVLVFKNDTVIAASMTNMPHAGVDSKTGGETVSNRSGGYGTGYNYDFIKNNGMDGHVDIHFKNSLRHKDNKIDPQHQSEVKKAAGK